MKATIKRFIFFPCIAFCSICTTNDHLWLYMFIYCLSLPPCLFWFFFAPLTIDFIILLKCYRLKYYSMCGICVLFLWFKINGSMCIFSLLTFFSFLLILFFGQLIFVYLSMHDLSYAMPIHWMCEIQYMF